MIENVYWNISTRKFVLAFYWIWLKTKCLRFFFGNVGRKWQWTLTLFYPLVTARCSQEHSLPFRFLLALRAASFIAGILQRLILFCVNVHFLVFYCCVVNDLDHGFRALFFNCFSNLAWYYYSLFKAGSGCLQIFVSDELI